MAPHRIDDFLELTDDIVPELVHPGYKYAGGDGTAVDTPDNLSNGVTEYDPIAIVGIGCRLPGEVKSAANLWDLLISKKSSHSRVPAERWNIDAFYHPNDNEKIGTMSMDSGYFIHEDLRKFENSFFGINNIEATFMDPQQRKLLEVVYECLESAGVPLDQVNGANIGTYVGSFTLDYWMMQTREPDYLHRYHATGMGTTILANRISHALNLRGPSFTLDTGCSASLYALHQACTALDAGECNAAIVAASDLLQSPEQQLGTMKAGVLSPTGTCHTFDETADGYGRADGLGALYIKKSSKAIADGDPIRSIIRGTAVNSNGKTPGISLPSQDGQEAVIRKAYAKAGLTNFDDTQYVECHGTGTPVGDPIEVEAVSRVFNRDVAAKGPLLIGSVKTNLGHSEAASDLSSIIKATLALENGLIPATIGVQNINPKIKVDEWAVQIVQENTRWPSSIGTGPPIRRISVNSFGYGGANSHAILDSASSYPSSAEDSSPQDLLHPSSKFIPSVSEHLVSFENSSCTFGIYKSRTREIGAAYAAERFSAAQAIIVAFYRGYVVGKTETTTSGAMMAVSLGEDTAKAEINLLGLGGSIKVACVNSPESVTISGDAVAIDQWLTLGQEYPDLLEKRVGPLLLPVEFTEAMWVSSVHEESVTGKILPSYWRKNLESPVRFSGALERLLKQTPIHLIEIGPHSALEMPIKQTCKKLDLSDAKFHYSSALSRGKDGIDCVLNLMGDLFLHGHDVSFANINYVETTFATGKQGKVLTDLPPYPWTYDQILFNESRSSRELRNRKYGHHDLLGLQTLYGDGLVTTWRNTLRVKDVSWLSSHRLGNDVVFPAAGYIAMAIESVCQVTGTTIADTPSFLLRHVNIAKALPLSVEENDPGVEIFTTLRPMKLTGVSNSAKWYDFEVGSFENGKSRTHATGSISLEMTIPTSAKLFSQEIVNFQSSATRNWYNRFAQVGLNFGQEFQSLERIEIDRKKEVMQARSTVQYLTGGGVGHATQADYIIHPITIDAMLQTALIASSAGTISDLACMVPTAIETARFKAPSSVDTPWFVDAVSQPVGPGSIQIAAELHDG
ncbi:hypothetical protein EPUS_00738 [Endocarpon pusillum Z07020]|uniref:Uncharacterized protein n=1 Tax=Endocarpon pusillum (strain Z07020 / HMAS-L-300199) TaxID=1263415 RepID=U1GQJ4_ENDPU|nr:uncharacterized protein EPUS_00738 [Endocarpon pusillum Z07020]ERF74608.1 hypothetical protein EPUS_00738 [Endocarpon pusillum Z07020]